MHSLTNQLNRVKDQLAKAQVQAQEDMDALKKAHQKEIHDFAKKHAEERLQMRKVHAKESNVLGQYHTAEKTTQLQYYSKQLLPYVDNVDTLHSKQRDMPVNYEKEKADLLARLNQMQTAHSKTSKST